MDDDRVRYLSFALTMTARLPSDDPTRERAMRALLARLESELDAPEEELRRSTWGGAGAA